MIMKHEMRIIRQKKKSCPTATFSNKNPTRAHLILNPVFLRRNLVTDRLSLDTTRYDLEINYEFISILTKTNQFSLKLKKLFRFWCR